MADYIYIAKRERRKESECTGTYEHSEADSAPTLSHSFTCPPDYIGTHTHTPSELILSQALGRGRSLGAII